MEARFTITMKPSQVLGDPDEILNQTDCHIAEQLIVGGKNAEPKEFPHMVRIRFIKVHYLFAYIYFQIT